MLFFSAKPRDEDAFDALRAEAVGERDLVVLPHVWEHYDNITHQTLEMCRAAALERRMTHLLKARPCNHVGDSCVQCGSLWTAARMWPAPPPEIAMLSSRMLAM